MHSVGKRRLAKGWAAADRLLELVIQLRGAKPFVPKGVYKYRSHEEAQQAMFAWLTRKRPAV